eukprot:gene5823-biopygen7056
MPMVLFLSWYTSHATDAPPAAPSNCSAIRAASAANDALRTDKRSNRYSDAYRRMGTDDGDSRQMGADEGGSVLRTDNGCRDGRRWILLIGSGIPRPLFGLAPPALPPHRIASPCPAAAPRGPTTAHTPGECSRAGESRRGAAGRLYGRSARCRAGWAGPTRRAPPPLRPLWLVLGYQIGENPLRSSAPWQIGNAETSEWQGSEKFQDIS